MPSCSERTGRVLDGRLVLGGLLWAALAACDGSGAASAGPDAGSCCGNCLPGNDGTYCYRCPGLNEVCSSDGYEGNGCLGLEGQALCDCILPLMRADSPPEHVGTCSVMGDIAIYTPAPAACLNRLGASRVFPACEHDPNQPDPPEPELPLPSGQGGISGR